MLGSSRLYTVCAAEPYANSGKSYSMTSSHEDILTAASPQVRAALALRPSIDREVVWRSRLCIAILPCTHYTLVHRVTDSIDFEAASRASSNRTSLRLSLVFRQPYLPRSASLVHIIRPLYLARQHCYRSDDCLQRCQMLLRRMQRSISGTAPYRPDPRRYILGSADSL
nr:hypothetical protein CFP56_30123 [Quercus suber]